MREALKACAALFFGLGLLATGHNFLSSLLGVRLTTAGYASDIAGFVLSGFYIGIVLAGLAAPRLILRVGHIRVFGAMAATGVAVAGVHALALDPWLWGGLRIVAGFATTTMYIVVESWVNDRAVNATRGRLLGIYLQVWLLAAIAGQGLLAVGQGPGAQPFILISTLYALGAIPLLLSTVPAPGFALVERLAPRRLWQMAPLGVIGAVMVGVLHGTLISMGPVFGIGSGLSQAQVGLFMAAALLGAAVLQVPIGRLADRGRRHPVMIGLALGGAVLALLCLLLQGDFLLLCLAFALYGGLCMPLYPVAMAIANDRLTPAQMVSAAATLNLAIGVGGILGPAVAGIAMRSFGGGAFFAFLATMSLLLAALTLIFQRGRATQ